MANYWFNGLGGQQHSSILAGWNDIDSIRIWQIVPMKVVGNHLLFPPIKFQSIWITRARDMTKILSSASGGRGGQPLSSCLDEMSLLNQNWSRSSSWKLLEIVLSFHPPNLTSFYLLKTPAMSKILSSVWAGLQDRFWLLFCGQTLNLKMEDLGLPLFMNVVGLFLRFLAI